jgi:hypothetical protein
MEPTASGTAANTVVVSGVGSARVAVVAELTVGLEASAETPGASLGQVTEASRRVLAAAAERGIADDDVRTESVSVRADVEHPSPRVVGYTAGHSLGLRFTDIAEAPTVIDAITQAAGDALRMGGFGLSTADTAAARATAATSAVADARTRAGQLAEAAGVRLGPVIAIVDAPEGQPRTVMRATSLGWSSQSADARLPVRPGTGEVTARVTVTFQLDGPPAAGQTP